MWDALKRLEDPATRRVLLSGLGQGVLVQHALRQPHITRVDVIECVADVIRLVRRWYRDRQRRLTVYQGDVLQLEFGRRRTWDDADHDIWQRITVGNLADMLLIEAQYRGRVGAQDFWARTRCEQLLRRALEQRPDGREVLAAYREATGRVV